MMMRSLLFSLPASRVCLAFISHSRSGVLRTDLRRLATTSNDVAEQCLAAKKASGKTFDDLASSLGYTNAYTCQLLLGQAQLKPEKKRALAELLPELSDETLDAMTEAPFRSFDSDILKEPNVYRTYEAITHYGQAIKALINEKFGDGIMSAIDFYLTVGEATGKSGERRVVITFNGAAGYQPPLLRLPPQANIYSTLSKMLKTIQP